MKCRLYLKTEVNNGEYYAEVRNRTILGELPVDVVEAMELLLDTEQIKFREMVNFETLVKKIEEKKSVGILSMPLDYYADIEEGIGSYVFFRACNVLEYLLGFSQSLGTNLPLDTFGIRIS